LRFDPFNHNVLFLGTSYGEIYRSTDAGAHWSLILGPLVNQVVSTILVDPAQPNNLYAGVKRSTSSVFQVGTAGVYHSTDGGASRKQFNEGLLNTDVLSLAIDPRLPLRLYAATNGGGVDQMPLGSSDRTRRRP
jgi:hypothetical protein